MSREYRRNRIKVFDLIGEVIAGVVFKGGVGATDQSDRDVARDPVHQV